ncbi:hypothetical protein GQ55_1G416300 [Panicum hallii var. hallii]|uniref:RING-type E3 ubiquitin transferase n=1 Tax=Panicum hallii var. hallii TaxID=1504633 RepID=A0A2T7FD14_9POAL|nr:hypothetical protein GQ55_1G416300 [Panicum hallii var. hallii]
MGKYSDGKDGETGGSYPLVAVCIDKDKNSQNALKYATETLAHKGQTIVLVHVNTKGTSGGVEDAAGYKQPTDPQMKDLFLPFRCFCTRKDIQCKDVVLDDHDVAKSIVEFAAHAAIEKLVVGATARGGFVRFKAEISSTISKTAPDFCTVYVVTKGGKVNSVRQAIRQAPAVSPLRTMIQGPKPDQVHAPAAAAAQKWTPPPPSRGDVAATPMMQDNPIMSPFARSTGVGAGSARKPFPEFSLPESSDISFIGSAPRRSTERYPPCPPRLSSGSEGLDQHSFEARTPSRWGDSFGNDSTAHSQTSTSSWCSQPTDDMEAEMKRLRLELKQTMDMYSTACKEALSAKQKAMELQRWKVEEEQRSHETRLTEESAMALIEQEKAKARAAIEAAQRLADLEAQKRIGAEMKALKEAEERLRSMGGGARESVRYRKYTIQEIELGTDHFNDARKVGEGGYGPVYKGHLDHTPVAIKVLRPDAAQGRSQFQQEVEVLSCIRHPNMVLLLGACPEYGCLVYEYMANGSLDDCLFRRGGGGPVIPWQHRFRIAAEIATGLLFLHQTKPEPLVHRDLKPGNILLDRNYVSKISDVGLARLVPPSVADSVTQCHMTAAAGTFCYIDPEYQQTGMLGVKSDVYSLGVMLLQIVTARPPMGLTHHVGRALERGTFADLLDPAVHDWPMEEAHRFAEVSLRCCELRRKDRPDLATVVLPELNRLRALGEDNMEYCDPMSGRGGMHSSSAFHSGPYSNPRHDGVSDPSLGRPHQQHSSNGSQAAMPTRRLNYN